MNTKLAKVRQDGALKMNDISPQTRKMCKCWIMGLGGIEHCVGSAVWSAWAYRWLRDIQSKIPDLC